MNHPDIPTSITESRPIEDVLRSLDFSPDPSGSGLRRRWGIVEFEACEGMFGWILIRSYMKRSETPPYEVREIGWPIEIHLRDEMAPVEVMALVYRHWAEANPGQPPADDHLLWAKTWLDYRAEIKAMIPPPPTIRADREFFRFCLSQIDRRHDWAKSGYDIEFSRIPGQLRIVAQDTEFYCPAWGDWLGSAAVSATDVFRRLPKRFLRDYVVLVQEGDKLIVDGHVISARWEEADLESQR